MSESHEDVAARAVDGKSSQRRGRRLVDGLHVVHDEHEPSSHPEPSPPLGHRGLDLCPEDARIPRRDHRADAGRQRRFKFRERAKQHRAVRRDGCSRIVGSNLEERRDERADRGVRALARRAVDRQHVGAGEPCADGELLQEPRDAGSGSPFDDEAARRRAPPVVYRRLHSRERCIAPYDAARQVMRGRQSLDVVGELADGCEPVDDLGRARGSRQRVDAEQAEHQLVETRWNARRVSGAHFPFLEHARRRRWQGLPRLL